MALKVFISSKMAELRDVREIVGKALTDRGIEAFVYEESAGARPETVVITSLQEVEEADVYVGLFWQKYGEVTVQEYRHAREHDKPCFVYIREKDLHREPELKAFLKAEVYDLTKGVTYDYFDSALQLGDAVARDVMAWLVRRYRELSAQVRAAEVSREEIEWLQAEVARLQAISREPLPQGDAVDDLARQLREWFHAAGYGLERDVQRSGAYAELIINIPRRRRGYDRILVRALDGEIEVSHVRDLRQVVDEQKFNEGWLVCERRVSKAAREEAEGHDDLFVYTFDELIDEDVDWDRYFAWLEKEVKTKGVDKYYVHLAGTVDDLSPEGEKLGTSRYENLDDYIDLWLDDPSKEHISILGEFGTGKTWFTLHYAYRMIQRYQETKAKGLRRPRVPLIIQLRNYAQGFKDVGALLSEFVFREHEIGLPGYRAFEQLNRMGRLLLIFDGFDEMAARVDRQKMVNNFWELAKVMIPGSKAILTCRTEHFHYAQQEREVLRGELRASTSAIVLEAPKFEVVHLEMLRERQVRDALHRRADVATVETVMSNPELVDMARRPVLIEFILEALPEVQEGKPADMAHIYYYAARRKMERDIKAERTFTSLADKLYFLCELFWEMLYTDQMSLNYKLFPERIRRYLGPKVAEVEEDHWHYDLLGQTMLARDADGNYTPAHRSLLEFFVAYKFAAEMGVLLPTFTDAARSQSAISVDMPLQDYTWSAYFRRERDEQGKIQPIPMLRAFVREPITRLANTVGVQSLTLAVLALMDGMVDAKRLWKVVEATRGHSVEEVGYTGGNAATLLRRKDESFKNAKLARTVLASADLFNTDLSGADLQGATLREANLSGCTLEKANLSRADLTDVVMDETKDLLCVAYGPEGRMVMSGDKHGRLVLWDARSGAMNFAQRVHSRAIRCLKLNRDGRYVVSASSDGTARIWQFGDFTAEIAIFRHARAVQSACFSAGGSKLFTGSGNTLVYEWDIPSGVLLRVIALEPGACGLDGYVWSEGFSNVSAAPEGRYLIAGLTAYDMGLYLVDLEWVEPIPLSNLLPFLVGSRFREISRGRLFTGLSACLKGPPFAVYECCFSPNGRQIAAAFGDGTLKVWQCTKLPQVSELWSSRVTRRALTSIAYSPNENLLVGGGQDGMVRIWRSGTGEVLLTLSGHAMGVTDVCFSPDGRNVATSSDDGTIRIWDVDMASPKFGRCVKVLKAEMNCRGLRLRGCIGLTMDKLIWLRERGAVLDEKQKKLVAEAKKGRSR